MTQGKGAESDKRFFPMLPLVISSSPFLLRILLMYFMFYVFVWWNEQCWIYIFESFQKFNILYLFQSLLCRTWKNSALNNKNIQTSCILSYLQ